MADIQRLFSERAQKNEEFKNKVILPTDYEFNLVKRFVDVFPDLMSVDYVSPKFLGLIGELFGFPYLETESPEVQREIIKRLVDTYKQKGAQSLIEKALKYSYNDNYVLGDLTYYRGEIFPSPTNITFTRDQMFRYDYSDWDWYKYSDINSIALGIIEIEGDRINDRTETYLEELIPAGIKYILTFTKSLGGDGEAGQIIYPRTADFDTIISYEPAIARSTSARSDALRYISMPTIDKCRYIDDSIWDGSDITVITTEIDYETRGAKLPKYQACDRMYNVSNVPLDWTPNMADEYNANL